MGIFKETSEEEKEVLIRKNLRNKKLGERIEMFWGAFIAFVFVLLISVFVIVYLVKDIENVIFLFDFLGAITIVLMIVCVVSFYKVFRCPHCDGRIRGITDFCPHCGEDLEYYPSLEKDIINKKEE